MRVFKVIHKTSLTLVMAAIAALFLFPIVIMFTNSFMTAQEIEINYGPIGQINESIERGKNLFGNLKRLPDQVSMEQYGKVNISR